MADTDHHLHVSLVSFLLVKELANGPCIVWKNAKAQDEGVRMLLWIEEYSFAV